MKDRRRKSRINYSIKRKMQIRILLKILLIVTIGVGVMGALFYVYSNREIGTSYRQFHIHARNFLEYLFPAVIISLGLAILSAIAVTIFFPHKIAGPLYRIERDLQEKIGNGDLTPRFVLRKGDEISDLANAINITLENLSKKIERIRSASEELDSVLGIKQEKRDEKIGRLAREIKDALQEFRV